MWHKPTKKQLKTDDHLLLVLIFKFRYLFISFPPWDRCSHLTHELSVREVINSTRGKRMLTAVLTSFDFPRTALSTFCFRRSVSLLLPKACPSLSSLSLALDAGGILSPAVSEPVLAEKWSLEEAGFDILGLWLLPDYYFLISWEQIRMKQIKESHEICHNWASFCCRHSPEEAIWMYPVI